MIHSDFHFGNRVVPKVLIFLIFIPLLLLSQSSSAHAVGNLRLGPIQVDPFASVIYILDDNVCRNDLKLCPDPEQPGALSEGSDLVARFETGVEARLPLRNHRIDGSYKGHFERYNKFKQENFSDSTAGGGLQLNFNGGLSLKGRNEWKNGHDPRGFNQNTELDFFRRNIFDGEAHLLIGSRMGVKGIYQDFMINYEDDVRNGFRDHSKETIGGQVFLKTFPKTFLFGEYSEVELRYERANTMIFPPAMAPNGVLLDSTEERLGGGLTWDLSSYTRGTIKGGYVTKEFGNIEEVTGIETVVSGGTAAAEIKHGFSSLTRAHLSFSYDLEESNIETQAYYRKTLAGAEISREVHPRILLSVRGGYSRDKYPEDDVNLLLSSGVSKRRLDNTWDIGGGFTYNRFDWLIFGIHYLRTDRKSTLQEFDYSINRYSFSLRVEL